MREHAFELDGNNGKGRLAAAFVTRRREGGPAVPKPRGAGGLTNRCTEKPGRRGNTLVFETQWGCALAVMRRNSVAPDEGVRGLKNVAPRPRRLRSHPVPERGAGASRGALGAAASSRMSRRRSAMAARAESIASISAPMVFVPVVRLRA